MYHDIYIKYKNKENEELHLQAAYDFEIRFEVMLLLELKEDEIEYIKIK